MSLLSAIGSIGGGLLGFLGSKERARAVERANEDMGLRPWGPVTPYMTDYMGDARNIYESGGFAPQANPLELMGRANTLGYAEGLLPELIGSAHRSWLQGLQPGLNPYVAPMIQAAQQDLVQDFMRNVMPAISDQAQGVGGYGGSRQGVAQGIASEGLLEALGDVETSLLSNAFNQAQGQQRAAWGAMPSMLQAGFLPSAAQQDTGAQYRADLAQPAANLTGYGSAMSPFFQFTNVAPAPVTQSPYGSALGGALVGNRLGGMFSNMNPTVTLPAASGLGGSGLGGAFLQNQ